MGARYEETTLERSFKTVGQTKRTWYHRKRIDCLIARASISRPTTKSFPDDADYIYHVFCTRRIVRIIPCSSRDIITM